MIFSKLNPQVVVNPRTFKLLNQSALLAHMPFKHLVVFNSSNTSSRSTNSTPFQYWNLKIVSALIASATLLGVAKLAKEEQKEETKGAEKMLVITPRQKLFFQFASVEFNGLPYMTPQDFLESVTEDHPRPRIRRKMLTKEMVDKYIKTTPGHEDRKGSSTHFFRDLEEKGLISYSEYLFLLCVITKPKCNFEIAFNMFDTDGNKKVDKNEFLVVTQIFQRESEQKSVTTTEETNKEQKEFDEKFESKNKLIQSLKPIKTDNDMMNTTLLVHFFGPKGKKTLEFKDFEKFTNNLQREILEIEFNEFSKGMNKISRVEFAEILLRYTKFTDEKKSKIMQRLNKDPSFFDRNISFDSFYDFSLFMNNLDDFSLALKFHTLANRSISSNEFQRAVKISSGFNLDEQIVSVIYNVFDENGDGELSYKEFIAVLKGRLRRGLRSGGGNSTFSYSQYSSANDLTQSDLLRGNDEAESVMRKFKNCIRRKLKENNYE